MSEPKQTVTRSWARDPVKAWSSTPIPEDPPLDERAVSELPDGARVLVLWGGGNGPHEYEIERTEDGTLWALSGLRGERGSRGQDPMWPSYLTSYGTERWQSKVWLLSADGGDT